MCAVQLRIVTPWADQIINHQQGPPCRSPRCANTRTYPQYTRRFEVAAVECVKQGRSRPFHWQRGLPTCQLSARSVPRPTGPETFIARSTVGWDCRQTLYTSGASSEENRSSSVPPPVTPEADQRGGGSTLPCDPCPCPDEETRPA